MCKETSLEIATPVCSTICVNLEADISPVETAEGEPVISYSSQSVAAKAARLQRYYIPRQHHGEDRVEIWMRRLVWCRVPANKA